MASQEAALLPWNRKRIAICEKSKLKTHNNGVKKVKGDELQSTSIIAIMCFCFPHGPYEAKCSDVLLLLHLARLLFILSAHTCGLIVLNGVFRVKKIKYVTSKQRNNLDQYLKYNLDLIPLTTRVYTYIVHREQHSHYRMDLTHSLLNTNMFRIDSCWLQRSVCLL